MAEWRGDITQKLLERDLLELGKSMLQVAKERNCSPDTVKRHVVKFGISLDPVIINIGSRYTRLLYLQEAKLTLRQRSIIVGSVLGDGGLNTVTKNIALTKCQCIRRRAYVEWLWDELLPFVSRPIHTAVTKLKKTGKSYKQACFSTVHHTEFTRYYNTFYPEGKKIVPKNIGDYLTEPLALAVWFMDDGYNNHKSSYSTISTQSFTEQECKLLWDVLYEQFGIESKVELFRSRGKSGPILRFRGTDRCKLHDMIDPLLHQCFEYKKLKLC